QKRHSRNGGSGNTQSTVSATAFPATAKAISISIDIPAPSNSSSVSGARRCRRSPRLGRRGEDACQSEKSQRPKLAARGASEQTATDCRITCPLLALSGHHRL